MQLVRCTFIYLDLLITANDAIYRFLQLHILTYLSCTIMVLSKMNSIYVPIFVNHEVVDNKYASP